MNEARALQRPRATVSRRGSGYPSTPRRLALADTRSRPGCLKDIRGCKTCQRLSGVTVALNGTEFGLPAGLFGILSVAESDPRLSANITTMIGQLSPVVSDCPHKLIAVKSSRLVPAPGVTEVLEIDTGAVSVFFNVTVLIARLNRPTVPNDRLDGVTSPRYRRILQPQSSLNSESPLRPVRRPTRSR